MSLYRDDFMLTPPLHGIGQAADNHLADWRNLAKWSRRIS
jgi:hypothetical protein